MKAAEQHARGKNNCLSTRVSALAIPWKRVALYAERDELITLLARRDPSATDRLVNVYSTYNKLANNVT